MGAAPVFEVTSGAGNLPRLTLVAPDGARAEIYQYGAQVVSWIPAGGQDRLFLSRASQFRSGAPIRGGIPVAFPQFGAFGPLPLHGLVRLMLWEFVGADTVRDQASAVFRLHDTETSRELWPHPFQAELTASIGGNRLQTTLALTNPGAEPFSFTAALHTYLRVSEISRTAIKGLTGLTYRDSAAGGIQKRETAPQVDFTGEVNRTYFAAPADTLLVTPESTTIIRKSGFTDTVVWNPAAEKCAAMPDLEPDDYRRFVCVEAVTVAEPVQLAPGKRWQGSQTLLA